MLPLPQEDKGDQCTRAMRKRGVNSVSWRATVPAECLGKVNVDVICAVLVDGGKASKTASWKREGGTVRFGEEIEEAEVRGQREESEALSKIGKSHRVSVFFLQLGPCVGC